MSALRSQPRAVYAVLFACVVAFMGIGLVDPILPIIAKGLHASNSDVELLFTSYFAIIGISNLVAGAASARFGPRNTMLGGLLLVVVFSAAAGASDTVSAVIGFRAGWGLGIALFISTSMSVIIGAARGGIPAAIILFESALGVGIASGPLLGSVLGGVSWRMPFFGVAALMGIAFIAIIVLVPQHATGPRPRHIGLTEPLRALSHRALLLASIVALLYNFGFFTLLAYTPLPLGLGVHELGFVFFAWGVLVALGAILGAPRLSQRFRATTVLAAVFALITIDLLVIGIGIHNQGVMIVAIIASGAFLGVGNATLSNLLLGVAVTDTAVASSATNFVRFVGGAIAPFLAGKLAKHGIGLPLYVGAGAMAVGLVVLVVSRSSLVHVGPGRGPDERDPAESLVLEESGAVNA
jgi:ACDE family multidrug resistance protein